MNKVLAIALVLGLSALVTPVRALTDVDVTVTDDGTTLMVTGTAGWTAKRNVDGGYTVSPPPTVFWVVAPNGTATTRPIYDRALFVGGTRKEVGRVAIKDANGNPTLCGAQVTTEPWREVAGGVSYCVARGGQ